jgi:lysophospholipase L1-like esterase
MKIREIASGLLVTVAAVFLSLVLSEMAVRVYSHWNLIYDIEMSRYAMDIKEQSPNPLIGHVHRPNSEARLMGVDVKINSDGFRDREYPVARDGKYRMIFLGDSLTFGWGVEKAKTFEEILERELSTRRPTEIINFGVGNYNTVQEVNLFLDKGLKYQPDQVVIFYFINDAEPTPHKSDWEFLANSRIVTFFWSRVNMLRARFGFMKSFQAYYDDLYTDGQPGWLAAKKALLQIRDICAAKHIVLQVVLLPELHRLDKYPFAAQDSKIMAFLHDNHIAALDLAPSFAGEKNPMRLWVAPDDAHPNAIAHALIAKYSLGFIEEGMHERDANRTN